MALTETKSDADELLGLADALNAELESRNGRVERSVRGQFATPSAAARAMAALVKPSGRALSVVDPGAGAGALMLALVASAIVLPDDVHRFINLPGNPTVMSAAARVAALPADLVSLGLSVSTGPVIDFRCREFLTAAQAAGSVPLIYPANLKAAGVKWPLATTRKAQGFMAVPQTRRWLFPNGPYVLIKRFTAKEEKRRIVARAYRPIDAFDLVAFENHVNVIHRDHGPLRESEANRLAEYLNSDLVDTYFRMFSGSTQVNATDLRRLRFPDLGVEPTQSLRNFNGHESTKISSARWAAVDDLPDRGGDAPSL